MQWAVTEIMIHFGAGLILGCFFYGGLWLTILRMTHFAKPTVVLVASSAMRLLLLLAGLYVLTSWQAPAVLFALAGFLLARVLIMRWVINRASRVTADNRLKSAGALNGESR